jgi:undecaprenyl-diphosphatase
MNIFEAVIYGFIQGVSEFLPVSSSGHLALLPFLMRIEDPGVVFDLMMHLGTGLAVLIYFRKDIWRYAKTFTPSLVNLKVGGEDRWFVRNFILSTFSSVCLIVLLMPISKLARNPVLIVINLTAFGILLWLSDRYNRSHKKPLMAPMEQKLQWKLAIVIGLSQALAIFPGVSRSGITLTAALFAGMNRKEAGAYSFLLSLPIILAGILKEVPDIVKEGNQDKFIVLLAGVISSFIVGWVTIHFFMKLIARIHLGYFTIYRIAIAILMLFIVL